MIEKDLYSKIYLANNTIVEMLIDRGYNPTRTTYDTIEDFGLEFRNVLTEPRSLNFVSKKDQLTTAVYFSLEEKIPKSTLEGIVQNNINDGCNNLIIIMQNKLNHACVSYLNSVRANIFVEGFLFNELLFNPTKHELVPHHKIMNQLEITELLKKHSCTLENLPKILSTDIITRYLGAKVNDVISIQRQSKTAKTSIYYRVVKNS
ncbi:RPAB1 [Hepatospora eriocheir]|uniref:RPAB1 n=1 Tax=Hepatospora eriocheir TaxID=1081669 RepID=A0A1X0QJA3_9MICR|nr:RPAB1 [Hepatospora eriocheir]